MRPPPKIENDPERVAVLHSLGIDRVGAQEFDLVLMDVEMPEMDGIAATRAIRADRRVRRQPTIVALTAHVAAEASNKFLAAGMDAALTKPIRLADLTKLLARGRGDAL